MRNSLIFPDIKEIAEMILGFFLKNRYPEITCHTDDEFRETPTTVY